MFKKYIYMDKFMGAETIPIDFFVDTPEEALKAAWVELWWEKGKSVSIGDTKLTEYAANPEIPEGYKLYVLQEVE